MAGAPDTGNGNGSPKFISNSNNNKRMFAMTMIVHETRAIRSLRSSHKPLAALPLLAMLCSAAPMAMAGPTCNSLFGPAGGGTIPSSAGLNNTGIDACLDNATLAVTNNGTLTNAQNASLTSQGNLINGRYIDNRGTFTNYVGSTLSQTTSASRIQNYGGSTLINSGTLINGSGSLLINSNATLVNNGTLTNNNAALSNGFSNSGTLTNAAGATLTNTANFVNNTGGVTINNGTLSSKNTVNKTGAILTNNNALTLSSGGTLSNSGSLNNNAGATLTNNGTAISQGTLTNNGAMTNNGTLTSRTLTNSGAIRNDAIAAALTVSSGGTLNNSGSITLAKGKITNSGQLTNSNGATLTVETAGTLYNEANATLTNAAGATLTNKGSIKNSGELANHGTIDNTGYFSGLTGGSITGTGVYNQQAGSTTVNGTMTQSAVSVTGGSLGGGGTIIAPVTVSENGKLISGFDIQGDLNLDGGRLANGISSYGSNATVVTGGSIYLTSGTFEFGYTNAAPQLGDSWEFLTGNVVGNLDNFSFSYYTYIYNELHYYDSSAFLQTITDTGITLSVISAPVMLNPVPLPGSVWLFSTGLAGMGMLARRKSRARHC